MGQTGSCCRGRPSYRCFFPPVTDAEVKKDPDTNESLGRLRFYARQVRKPLRTKGIEFHELYTRSFRVRVGGVVTAVRTRKAEVGYYFIVPGKEPRIEYGVVADADLLQISNRYLIVLPNEPMAVSADSRGAGRSAPHEPIWERFPPNSSNSPFLRFHSRV
jgi:hypothetical protein